MDPLLGLANERVDLFSSRKRSRTGSRGISKLGVREIVFEITLDRLEQFLVVHYAIGPRHIMPLVAAPTPRILIPEVFVSSLPGSPKLTRPAGVLHVY